MTGWCSCGEVWTNHLRRGPEGDLRFSIVSTLAGCARSLSARGYFPHGLIDTFAGAVHLVHKQPTPNDAVILDAEDRHPPASPAVSRRRGFPASTTPAKWRPPPAPSAPARHGSPARHQKRPPACSLPLKARSRMMKPSPAWDAISRGACPEFAIISKRHSCLLEQRMQNSGKRAGRHSLVRHAASRD
jgi:hypothetical protein